MPPASQNPHSVQRYVGYKCIRIRFGPASPKLSGIRETGLFQGKIHTALIWENVRSEFGPAQQFLTPFLFSVHDTFAGPLHHSQPYGRFTNTPLDFLFVAQECIEARQLGLGGGKTETWIPFKTTATESVAIPEAPRATRRALNRDLHRPYSN